MKLELEQQNFRINSKGWEKKHDDYSGIEYLENPEGDVWEIASGEFKGEQLFSWDAAMRETKKAGKRMPTDKEWNKLLKTKEDMPNLKLAGYRYTDGTFYYLGTYAFFWSSSQSGTSVWGRFLNSGHAMVSRYLVLKELGFSVHCLRTNKTQQRDKNGRCISKKEDINNMIDNIKAKKLSEIYRLTKDKFKIYAKKEENGKISIRTKEDESEFEFINSTPETLKAIGELIVKASEL